MLICSMIMYVAARLGASTHSSLIAGFVRGGEQMKICSLLEHEQGRNSASRGERLNGLIESNFRPLTISKDAELLYRPNILEWPQSYGGAGGLSLNYQPRRDRAARKGASET